MMSLWDALRMNMMISYQELVRTFLRRYYHLSNGMESKSVDTRSIYRELGATLSYNMRLGNGMEMNPG